MNCVLFALCFFGSVSFGQERPVDSLASYVGRDVRKMDAEEKRVFVDLFRTAAGDDQALSQKDWEFVPQTLYEFDDPKLRFFVEIAPGFDRPGFCGLRLHYFGPDWSYDRRDSFSTGYRQEIVQVRRLTPKALGCNALVVKTISAGPWTVDIQGQRVGTPFFSGKHQLQYYAVVGDALMLVRREDESGNLVLNQYSNWSVPEIGMNYPQGTTAELLEVLRSKSETQKLALLVWLSGKHMSSTVKRRQGVSQEPLESLQSYEELCKSAELAKVVRELRQSDNLWIREYAERIPIGEPADQPLPR